MADLSPREIVIRNITIELVMEHMLYADRTNPEFMPTLSPDRARRDAAATVDGMIEYRIADITSLVNAAAGGGS